MKHALTRRRWGFAIAGLVALALVASGCSSGTSSSGSGTGELVIGLPLDLTGKTALFGLAQQRAAELAVKEINAANGPFKVRLVIKDCQGQEAVCVAQTQSIVNDKSVSVLSGFILTNLVQAAMPVAKAAKIPSVFMLSTDMTGRSDDMYSMTPAPAHANADLVSKVFVPRNVKTLALIHQEQPTLTTSANQIKTAATGAGISIVADEAASLTDTDFSSQVTAALAKNPDAIVLQMQVQNQGSVVAQLRQQGYKGIVAGEQTAGLAAFRKIAGDAASGYVFTTLWDPSVANAQAKTYIDKYKAAYPTVDPPYVYDILAWDAIHIIYQAAVQANSTDRAKIAAALKGNFPNGAVADTLHFGSDGFLELTGHVVEYKSASDISRLT